MILPANHILPRQFGYYDECYDGDCGNSNWYRWGRWVLLGCIVVGAILIFFLFSCLSARRRRRMGYSPYRGTGWTLGMTPPGHGQAQYTSQPYYGNAQPQQEQVQQPYYNNSNNPPPPPAYSPPPNNTYYGNNQGIELQQPGATYQGYRSGEEAYAPPKEPPRAK